MKVLVIVKTAQIITRSSFVIVDAPSAEFVADASGEGEIDYRTNATELCINEGDQELENLQFIEL